ncbi:uncharacterized protein BXZ73DRAFT_80615 [Epithele typhae]|uniref:uncharacterized protein n=1 Tax=Epithele typhae TaxID=378194 RepID=UPI002007EB6A|nr:uncharacterized protein BXZ73DRAFT_80615 [Epithele typhae]KAH9918385.1 hypothetical protein BXZ73DRAFT_80615 [Epithele typhae]
MSFPIQTCGFTSEHPRTRSYWPDVTSGDILYLQETVQSPIFEFLINRSEQDKSFAAFTPELIGDIKYSYNALVSSLEGKQIRSRPATVHPRSRFSFAPNAVGTPPLIYLMTSFGRAEDLNKVKIPGIPKYFSVPVYHPQTKDDPSRPHIHLTNVKPYMWDTSRVIAWPYSSGVRPDYPVRKDGPDAYRMPPERFGPTAMSCLRDISDTRAESWLKRPSKKVQTDVRKFLDTSSTLSGDYGSLWEGKHSVASATTSWRSRASRSITQESRRTKWSRTSSIGARSMISTSSLQPSVLDVYAPGSHHSVPKVMKPLNSRIRAAPEDPATPSHINLDRTMSPARPALHRITEDAEPDGLLVIESPHSGSVSTSASDRDSGYCSGGSCK